MYLCYISLDTLIFHTLSSFFFSFALPILYVLQMSFLARTFSQIIARSGTTTTTALLLKPRQPTSFTLRLASTPSSQQSNKLKKFHLFLFLCTYIGGDYEKKKYEYLLVDVKGQNSNVALVQLNRPKALNALCDGLMKEVRAIFIY